MQRNRTSPTEKDRRQDIEIIPTIPIWPERPNHVVRIP